jgi:hypothetical protein
MREVINHLKNSSFAYILNNAFSALQNLGPFPLSAACILPSVDRDHSIFQGSLPAP